MQDAATWARRLGLASVAMTVLLMTLGAWVKANGAGLACPDWPLCYGKAFPPFPSAENGGTWNGQAIGYTQAQELYEWAHRAVVSLTFVPVLAFAVLAARRREFAAPLRLLPAVALGLYLFQALLGYVTVATRNPPWATTMHLLTATSFLVVLTVATCVAYLRPTAGRRKFEVRQPPARTGYTYPGESSPPPAFPGEVHGR